MRHLGITKFNGERTWLTPDARLAAMRMAPVRVRLSPLRATGIVADPDADTQPSLAPVELDEDDEPLPAANVVRVRRPRTTPVHHLTWPR